VDGVTTVPTALVAKRVAMVQMPAAPLQEAGGPSVAAAVPTVETEQPAPRVVRATPTGWPAVGMVVREAGMQGWAAMMATLDRALMVVVDVTVLQVVTVPLVADSVPLTASLGAQQMEPTAAVGSPGVAAAGAVQVVVRIVSSSAVFIAVQGEAVAAVVVVVQPVAAAVAARVGVHQSVYCYKIRPSICVE